MRKKLIELIIGGHQKYYEPDSVGNTYEVIADHLIANGVTIPVRCQDCKHWKNEINGCTEDKRFCDIGFYMVHKDGFCSFGERS